MTPLTIIGLYFLIGAFVLLTFDAVTKRIRAKLDTATAETQSKMANAGAYMSGGASKVLFITLMWLFWPMVLVGAATGKKKGNKNGPKEQGTSSTSQERAREVDSPESSEQPPIP